MSDSDSRARAVEDAMWAAVDAIYIPPPTTKAASDMCCDLSVGGTPDYATVEGRDYFLRGLGLIEQQARAEVLAEYTPMMVNEALDMKDATIAALREALAETLAALDSVPTTDRLSTDARRHARALLTQAGQKEPKS